MEKGDFGDDDVNDIMIVMMMIVIISQIASHLSTQHNSHDPEPTLMETEPAHTTLDLTPIC